MLFGRDSQLAALEELLGRARDGSGGALAIHAEPGMGKTAMLEAAARTAVAAGDFRVFGIRGVRDESALPLAGLHRLLPPLADQVAALPSHHAEALAPVLTGRADVGEPLALYAAVTVLLAQAAASGPVLCWADDVHRLDAMSLNALAFAARRLATVPVAMLFAARNEHLTKEAYGRLAEIAPLALPPLDEPASRRLMADRCPAGIDDELAAALAELAGGNPLALVELATALTPEQLCGAEPPPETLPLSSRLRGVYRRRFFRLSPDGRMLTLLAVADDRLDAATLAKAAAAGGLDLRELESARVWGLLRVDGDSISLPSPVLRGALYADAPLAQRRAAHELLARVLDDERHWARRVWHRTALAGGPDETLGAELAAAAAAAGAAGNYADAVRAWTRAAALTARPDDRAARLLAAARHAWLDGRGRRARALLRRVPPAADADDRLRAAADLLRGEIELRDGTPATARRMFLYAADRLVSIDRRAAITALAYAGEASCVDGNLRQYVRIARRATPLRRAGAEEPDIELLIAHIEGMATTYHERYREAAGPLRRVLELADDSDDCTAKIWASIAALILADDRRAREFATQAAGFAYGADGPLKPWALTLLVIAEFWLGHYKTAADHALEGLRLSRAMGQENYAAEHLALLALLTATQGDKETTLLRLGAMTDVATRRGLARAGAFGSWAHACLELIEDRPADAAGRMRLMAGIWHVHPLVQVMAMPHFVEAAVRCGQRQGARQAVEVFDRWATSTGSAARLALAERCRALLADDEAAADEHFREAIALHHKGASAFELARTELLYGNLLRRGRKPLAAREHLRGALQIFRYYDAGYWIDVARAELRATGEAVADTVRKSADDLTTQQLQIARLAAEGATNKEIATRLILSPRTVEHHLRNVFVRLEIRSRTELSRYFR